MKLKNGLEKFFLTFYNGNDFRALGMWAYSGSRVYFIGLCKSVGNIMQYFSTVI